MSAPQVQLRIRLVRSLIGYPDLQRQIALGLGLRKPQDTVIRPDTPAVRGMITKITHLLNVEILP